VRRTALDLGGRLVQIDGGCDDEGVMRGQEALYADRENGLVGDGQQAQRR
jgi:hypothetical protein